MRRHPLQVGARVTDEVRDALLALRPLYPGADGVPASISSVLRGILHDGMPLLEPEVVDRVRALARDTRREPRDVLREALTRGLAAIETR